MKVRSFTGRLIAGWVLIIAGAAWCWEAKQVHEPPEGAAVGSFMFIGGCLAVRSGVRRRRHQRLLLEDAELLQRGGYGTPRRFE